MANDSHCKAECKGIASRTHALALYIGSNFSAVGASLQRFMILLFCSTSLLHGVRAVREVSERQLETLKMRGTAEELIEDQRLHCCSCAGVTLAIRACFARYCRLFTMFGLRMTSPRMCPEPKGRFPTRFWAAERAMSIGRAKADTRRHCTAALRWAIGLAMFIPGCITVMV